MNNEMIKVEGLHKSYGDNEVLKGIDVTIAEQEVVVVIGPSGGGKSTFLRCLNYLEVPTSGTITFDGIPLNGEANINEVRQEVGMVFQKFNLFPHMTVMDNLTLAPTIVRHESKEEAVANAKKYLDKVGLLNKADAYPSSLSGGQQQRVAIARALVNNPKVLLLDEPLGALDYKLRKTMQVELRSLQQRLGITFIYVTHDQEEALTMSDRVIIVNGGRIEQDDPPEKIYQYPRSKFAASFIGENNFFPVPGDDSRLLSIRPQFLVVTGENEATPPEKKPRYTGTIEQILFCGTFDKLFIRLDDNRQVITAYQYYDEHRDWDLGDRVGIWWNPQDSVQVTK